MSTVKDVVAAAAAGDTAPGYGGIPEPLENLRVKAYARINIDTNSDEGRAVLANVVGTALTKAGFTNLMVAENYATGTKPFEAKKPETVLEALTARNPSFLNTQVDISAVGYPWAKNIAPDSDYPCNGGEIVRFESDTHVGSGSVFVVDNLGGRDYIGNVTAPHVAKVIAALNKDLPKKKK